ncbi:hypothetical protein FACS1894186_3030 [Alphaproteobacteria bacterium]|nr:hypothetical protein FACS1894186_3030 [Alphaproteobacteria bacterium]
MRTVILFSALLCLSACAEGLILGAIAETGSMVATGRTVGDHAAGAMTGQDCSIDRAVDKGGAYCQPKAPPPRRPAPPPRLVCEGSLADYTCYKADDQ